MEEPMIALARAVERQLKEIRYDNLSKNTTRVKGYDNRTLVTDSLP